MLTGAPWPAREVAMFSTVLSGTPLGKRLASRGSATLQGVAHCPVLSGRLITTGGKLGSRGTVVECRCLKAGMVATGPRRRSVPHSGTGVEPRDPTETEATYPPTPQIRSASS